MALRKKPKKTSKRKARSGLWSFVVSGIKKKKKTSEHPRVKIARKHLSKRVIGKKSGRKIHLTIIGFVVVMAISIGLSPLSDYFKASILSLSQKNAVVSSARARLGVPYQMGGVGPGGFDCSGLTQVVMLESLNVKLPRISRDQYTVGREIAFANVGIGDLLFFTTYTAGISHVGIVTEVRSGKVKMISANSYTGKVEEELVEGYWLQNYVGAREITSATKNLVASSSPDPTYTPPPPTNTSNQYNNYFPASEIGDPRLKVGAATIEENNTNISDINLEGETATINNGPPTPTPTATVTPTPVPLLTINPAFLPTTEPTPTVAPTPTTSATPALFSDLDETDRAYDDIKKLVDLNVISGYSDGTFRPDAAVTRAELLKMVYKALNKRASSGNTPFKDINNHPLAKYIASAYNAGIVKGYPDKTFKPQNSVTRAEGAKIILKAFGINPEDPRRQYSDLDQNNELNDYLGYLSNHRILRAVNSQIKPNQALTRAEVAVILSALLE